MIRLKSLLLKEGRTNDISIEAGREIYNKHIGSAFHPNQNDEIYRGLKNASYDVGFIEPAKYTRRSAHTDNYYTLLMDNLKSWGKYPDRSKSIVCTTSIGTAKDYGELYMVLPFSGADIGVAPKNDMWNSFPFRLVHLNSYINKMVGFANEDKEKAPQDSFEKFKSYILKLDKKLKERDFYRQVLNGKIYRDKGFKNFIYNFISSPVDNLFEYLKVVINPERNGFKIEKYQKGFEVGGRSYPGKEVWTESPSLLLRHDGDFLKEFFKDERHYQKNIDKIE